MNTEPMDRIEASRARIAGIKSRASLLTFLPPATAPGVGPTLARRTVRPLPAIVVVREPLPRELGKAA